MSTNIFKRLLDLLPADPIMVGDVTTVWPDGTATVTLISAGTLRVRNPQAIAAGGRVFIQSEQITGPAPTLPIVTLEI